MRCFVALCVLAAVAGRADAHQSSMKYVDLTVDGRQVTARFTIAPTDATEPLGLAADAKVTVADAANPVIAAYVAHWLAIAIPHGPPCPGSTPSAVPDDDGKFVVVSWVAICPQTIDTLELDFRGFFGIDLKHEAIVDVHAPGEEGEPAIVRADEPIRVVHAGEAASLFAWVRYGMDHIYSGRDHISFVLALLLVIVLQRGAAGWETRAPGTAIKKTATIITAFTVAHSMSLIAASLGWVRLPSRLVESAIAVSIMYTAIENQIRPDVRWRYFLTFGFGLIHGLGFASALQELLPADHVLAPLLSFNVGVELGQLTIVIVALPLFWLACRELGGPRYRRWLMPALSSVIAVLGAIWLIERVFAITLLGM